MQKIFKFRSGYSIAMNPDYSARMVGVLSSAWESDNPKPEPNVRIDKVKGGTREVKLTNTVEFQNALAQWQNARDAFQNETLLKLALDAHSIDKEIVEEARQAMFEEYGTRGEDDDLKFYLNLVGDPGYGSPEDDDYVPNEIFDLMRFISDEKGPSGALVEHLLKKKFRHTDLQQENGRVSVDLGSLPESGTTPKNKAAK